MPIQIEGFVQLRKNGPTEHALDMGIETELSSELFLEPELCIILLWTKIALYSSKSSPQFVRILLDALSRRMGLTTINSPKTLIHRLTRDSDFVVHK